MNTKLFALGALSVLTLAAPAFAGTPANASAGTVHTPMTPEQSRALWQAAQTKLKADHLYNGPINGERTDATLGALRNFQSRNNLPETGSLDHATRQALGI
jgi:peptidoglycan hydrolase-like protein with peptidoglycan-binding domain